MKVYTRTAPQLNLDNRLFFPNLPEQDVAWKQLMLCINLNMTVKFTFLTDATFCGMAPQLYNTEELCDVGRPVAVGTVALWVNMINFYTLYRDIILSNYCH